MERFIQSIKLAIENKNWYAALFISLSLPDICDKIEFPNLKSGDRYIKICQKYLEPLYTHEIGAQKEKHVFLSANDCYSLRCSLLHEGSEIIQNQKSKAVLNKFRFVTPPFSHCLHVDDILCLRIDIFCQDICKAIESWSEKNQIDISQMITIYDGKQPWKYNSCIFK